MAVTWLPLCEIVAFQGLTTCCPALYDQRRVQPEMGSPRLVTTTLPVKPPGHSPATE